MVCKSDLRNRNKEIIKNKSQTICVVKTDLPIVECNLMMQLGSLMMDQVGMKIEKAMESDDTLQDLLICGANLTFLDFSDVTFYEMEVKGQKPVYVNCDIDNIDDKCVVLALPAPKGCSAGMIVRVPLPNNKMIELKSILKEDWCIV